MHASPESVQASRIRLMLDHPYLASAITRYPLHACSDPSACPIMATDGFHIFYNLDGLSSYSPSEQLFILAHEVVHCLFGHVDRREMRDPQVWNIAIDYATNLLLKSFGLKAPKDCLLDQRFWGRTAEEIYDILIGEAKEGKGRMEGSVGFDIHVDPGSMAGKLLALGLEDKESPSSLERTRIRKSLLKEFKVRIKGRGTLPCDLEDEIQQAGGGKVPWEQLLARFFSGLRRDDYRLYPVSKKHIWRGLYLPSIGRPGPSHVIVAIDTSGSMGDEILGRVLAEIDKLRSFSPCRLTLLQCDASIQKVEEFDEHTHTDFKRHHIHGRGGTAFEPVFDWLSEKSQDPGFRPDVLFYMTDGYGSFPDTAPSLPVAWILTEGEGMEVPFGQKVPLN